MPRSSRSASISSETFGMSRVISSAPSLVSRASTSCSSMWIEVRTSSCTRRWRQDDRVLVVVTLPRHERDQQVATERHLALVGAGTVGERRALLDPLPGRDQRTLVDAGALVGATELRQPVRLVGAVVVGHVDQVGADRGHHARLGRRRSRRRRRPRRGTPCRCPRTGPRSGSAARPDAACSSPSARGTRRRARGTGSSRWRPTPSGAARRPCSARRRPGRSSASP